MSECGWVLRYPRVVRSCLSQEARQGRDSTSRWLTGISVLCGQVNGDLSPDAPGCAYHQCYGLRFRHVVLTACVTGSHCLSITGAPSKYVDHIYIWICISVYFSLSNFHMIHLVRSGSNIL